MPGYRAPLEDMRFVLTELHDSAQMAALPGCEAFTPELMGSVLEAAGQFTG